MTIPSAPEAIATLLSTISHHRSDYDAAPLASDTRHRVAGALIDAYGALMATLEPRVGVDCDHPQRVAVTLLGVDVYVERTPAGTTASFGTDELPEQHSPLTVDEWGH